MHKMNRSLVAEVSWYNFKLIWSHRSLVSKTIKRKIINLLQQERLKKQCTQAVATPHNITINNKLNLHYLKFYSLLQKNKRHNLVQNIFLYLFILWRVE